MAARNRPKFNRVLHRRRSHRPCPLARRSHCLRRTGAALSISGAGIFGANDARRLAFGRRFGSGNVFESLAAFAFIPRRRKIFNVAVWDCIQRIPRSSAPAEPIGRGGCGKRARAGSGGRGPAIARGFDRSIEHLKFQRARGGGVVLPKRPLASGSRAGFELSDRHGKDPRAARQGKIEKTAGLV